MANQQVSDNPTRPEYLPEPKPRATESSDLIAMVTKHHPDDVRRILSRPSTTGKPEFKVPSQPTSKWKVNATCTYLIVRSNTAVKTGALIVVEQMVDSPTQTATSSQNHQTIL